MSQQITNPGITPFLEAITRLINGFNGVRRGIQFHNVSVPDGTPIEEYGPIIRTLAGPRKIVIRFRGFASEDMAQYQWVQGLKVASWGVPFDAPQLPFFETLDAEFSYNCNYLALGHVTPPYFSVYTFDGQYFIRLSMPQVVPLGSVTCVSWSPNGRYLALGSSYVPYFFLYEVNGTTLTNIPTPSIRPPGIVNDIGWMPDSSGFAIGHNSSSYLSIYTFDGTNPPVYLDTPTTTDRPTDTVTGVSWSPNGRMLAVSYLDEPFLSVYTYDNINQVLTRLPNSTHMPLSGATDALFSPNGKYLAVSYNTPGTILMYQIIDDMYVYLQPPDIEIPASTHVAFSFDTSALLLVHKNEPFVSAYSINRNNIILPMNNPAMRMTLINNVKMSVDGRFMAIAGAPNTAIYDTQLRNIISPISRLADIIEQEDDISYKFMGVGFVMSDFLADEKCVMDLLFLSNYAKEVYGVDSTTG